MTKNEIIIAESLESILSSEDSKAHNTIDLLNRGDFIDQIIKIIELTANNRKSIRFAINGSWGVGKSFVLDIIEKRLEKIQSETSGLDKYMVFHYNCWEYDYYEEPLVAIVASMLDTIDEKENLISNDMKSKIKGLLKAVGSALLIKGGEIIEEKTGVNVNEIIGVIKNGNINAAEDIENQNKYDSNFIFKATLKKLQETIDLLSKDKTIIFVVDELDRCLPEYSIKVLERLHHIFEKSSNIQVVLSIDKAQLEHTIKTIFGGNTKAEKYLSKFINFEVKLDEGVFNELVDEKFNYYIDMFKALYSGTQCCQVDEFKTKIFDGIDIRSRYEIINKCDLLHRLLVPADEKQDYSLMCIELLLTVLKHINFKVDNAVYDTNNPFYTKDVSTKQGLDYLNGIYKNALKTGYLYHEVEVFGNTKVDHIRTNDIYGVLLASFRYILGYPKDKFSNGSYDRKEIINHTNDFWSLLQVISWLSVEIINKKDSYS